MEAEKFLLSLYKDKKFPVTIIRPSSVYGPQDRGTYYAFFKTIERGLFFLIGTGKNQVSFVFVKNVVKAAILAAKKRNSSGKIYFITDARPYTMKELSETIAAAFGKKINSFRIPVPLGYLIGFSMDIINKFTGLSFPLSVDRVKNLTISYVLDIKRAKKELDYQPEINLKEGTKITANWYKIHGWI